MPREVWEARALRSLALGATRWVGPRRAGVALDAGRAVPRRHGPRGAARVRRGARPVAHLRRRAQPPGGAARRRGAAGALEVLYLGHNRFAELPEPVRGLRALPTWAPTPIASKRCPNGSASSARCSSCASRATRYGRSPTGSAACARCASFTCGAIGSRRCPKRSVRCTSCVRWTSARTGSRRCPRGSPGCRRSSASTCAGTASSIRRPWSRACASAAASSGCDLPEHLRQRQQHPRTPLRPQPPTQHQRPRVGAARHHVGPVVEAHAQREVGAARRGPAPPARRRCRARRATARRRRSPTRSSCPAARRR